MTKDTVISKKNDKDNSISKDAIILLTDVMFKKTDFLDLQQRYPDTDFSDPFILEDVKKSPLLNYDNIEKGTVLKIDLFAKKIMVDQLVYRGHASFCNYEEEINKIKDPEKVISDKEKLISEQNLQIQELLKKLEGNNKNG